MEGTAGTRVPFFSPDGQRVGFWTEERRRDFGLRMAATCARRVPDGALAAAVCGDDWEAVYSCGYGMFAGDERDPFRVWTALVEEARTEGRTYHQGMLERVLLRSGCR